MRESASFLKKFYFVHFRKGVLLQTGLSNQIFLDDFIPPQRENGFRQLSCFLRTREKKFENERVNWRHAVLMEGPIGMTTVVNYDRWTPCNRCRIPSGRDKGESSGFILKRPFDSLGKGEFRSFRYIRVG